MSKLRVLVVEDSMTVRRHIVEVLSADPDLEVVAETDSGGGAIDLCQTLRPDVVTLDMALASSTGLEATEQIMAHCPTPILIVSSSTNRGEAFSTFDALSAGAVDVLEKPAGTGLDADWERRLVGAVKMTARIRVITHIRGRQRGLARAAVQELPEAGNAAPRALRQDPLWLARAAVQELPEAGNAAARTLHQGSHLLVRGAGSALRDSASPISPKASSTAALQRWPRSPRLVAIGTSTGGPGAMATILRALPVGYPIPILLVLHITKGFASSLAEWLGTVSSLPVRIALDGEPVPQVGQPGVVMAPADQHLVIEGGRLRLTSTGERNFCRPSVDVLFDTVASELGIAAAACLLTGMGRDGAEGLLAIRNAGGLTIAEAESSAVVYGMPREAVERSAATWVLPLPDVATALADLCVRSRKGPA